MAASMVGADSRRGRAAPRPTRAGHGRTARPAAEPAAYGGRISKLVRELRRRQVFRVAFTYGTVAWVLVQASALLLPALGLPGWSVTLVAVLMVLMFPVALVLAWAYDLPPQERPGRAFGLRRGRRATARSPGPAPSRGSAALSQPDAVTRADRPAAESLRSIAALPFVDRSPNGEHQFLGDGITEELITALARVSGLRVISRTSSFAFRAEGVDVRDVGARLGVGAIVEGSIRVSRGRLRMTAQLVAAADGCAIWSGTFDRDLDDLFVVQEEVARSIVDALRARLDASEGHVGGPVDGPLVQRSSSELEAYSLYLLGRMHWNERSAESLRLAIRCFEQATRRDRGFAHAYAGLADCYAILLDYGTLAPAEGLGAATVAAEQALRLGEGLAESHASAALVKQMQWDWAAAEDEFRVAISLNPGYALAPHRLALLLAWTGRSEQARREIDAAVRLDPLSPAVAASAAWIDYVAGDYAAAIAQARETLEQHPRFQAARVALAQALLQRGMPADAVSELERVLAYDRGSASAQALSIYALASAGRTREARQLLERLQARATNEYVSPYYLAVPLVGLGDLDGAIASLEAGLHERSPQLVYLAREPMLEPIRGLPAFRRILDRVQPGGLPSIQAH